MHISVPTHPMASSSITEGYRYILVSGPTVGTWVTDNSLEPRHDTRVPGNMTDVSRAVMETPCVKMLVAKAAKHCEVCTLHCR